MPPDVQSSKPTKAVLALSAERVAARVALHATYFFEVLTTPSMKVIGCVGLSAA